MNPESKKQVVLTCVQPTGLLHLGNYLGAVKPWTSFLGGYECYFGIVDMHSITMPYVPAELRAKTLDTAAQYIACGLDPDLCNIFVQSQVGYHADLAWILGCLCPYGQLQRMTQFKDKSQRTGSEFVGAGLLYYPILQAADILLYNADVVPVGEDQRQHLELTRDLAEKFNSTYSDTFKIPEISVPKSGARVMSLQDPEKKMSKSDKNQNSVIYLWDEPEVILKKFKSAVTDNGSEIIERSDKPGITNLLHIMSVASGQKITDLETEFEGEGYGVFKIAVAESVIEQLRPLREKYHDLKHHKDYLLEVLEKGRNAARRRAEKIIRKVYRKIGYLESSI